MIWGNNTLGDIRWTKLLVKEKTDGKQTVTIYGTTSNSGPHGPIICELLVSRHQMMKHDIIVSYVIQRLKKIFSAFSNLIFMHESMISNFNNHLLLPTRPTSWAFLFMKILLLAIKLLFKYPTPKAVNFLGMLGGRRQSVVFLQAVLSVYLLL